MIVAGGRGESSSLLDSTEMLMYGDEAWSVIESLKLPALIIAPFLISIKNLVFLTGRFFVAIALGSDPFRHWNKKSTNN